MAAVIEMGEVDEIHSKDETIKDVNGVCNFNEKEVTQVSKVVENNTDEGSQSPNYPTQVIEDEKMDVEEVEDSDSDSDGDSDKSDDEDDDDDDEKTESEGVDKPESYTINDEIRSVDDDDDDNDDDGSEIEVSDQDDEDENGLRNGNSSTDEGPKSVESDENTETKDADVVVIEDKDPIENGSNFKSKSSDNIQVINLDSPIKKKKFESLGPIRRSSRNAFKDKVEEESLRKRESSHTISDESDIEEILPEDPLADSIDKNRKESNSTIVVKDTKRLVEIASKSSPSNNNKKEPTLVIIDTNSILSGRGPVPVSSKSSTSVSNSFSMLPMALPAQGVYPPNMRATITPIPMTQSKSTPPTSSSPVPVLPTLTDDMFVVEAPSFIVPYVYEKPPLKDLKEFVNSVRKEVLEQEKKDEEDDGSDKGDNEKENDDKSSDLDISVIGDMKKSSSYFDSPLGKFFVGIGFSLVQEAVQTDLLRQQKRKKEREGGQNTDTKKTISTLLKNLEFSKENNEPFRMQMKKCEFCSYKTESALAMAFHLETPHMKNYVYRCNFCPYEVRSPHDILFHMEVQHGVRGRLERAPAFHQCPNCPFEDNQKGKLSRHLVACTRKFKPERNLEPPIDWEPPAKIPRAPRMKSQSFNAATAVYQAMAKSSQYQLLSKMQGAMSVMQRGRGRPMGSATTISKSSAKSTGMLYKQGTMSGGSVLVPTNYQLSGSPLYQVVGQEMGGRSGTVATSSFLPQMAATPSIQTKKPVQQPSISITPLPRGSSSSSSTPSVPQAKPGDSNSKNSFVICEICDGYIKDLEQLRNHMQWIHKVKIHPKMIYNRPPLNCQKCQFRFFTDQGLERHLLGSHGLVTSSMQEAANKSKDAGRCPVCGRVYQWKLLNHVARDHNMTLKPAHLSYKCTVCTATFGMYKQFESHVYSAHSVVAKRSMDKKTTPTTTPKTDSILKPLKINDEITIIPQPAKSSNGSASTSSTSAEAIRINSNPSTSKSGSDSSKTV